MTVQMYSLSGNSLPLTKNTTYKNPRETENRSKCKSTAFKKHYDAIFFPPPKGKIIDKSVSELYKKNGVMM